MIINTGTLLSVPSPALVTQTWVCFCPSLSGPVTVNMNCQEMFHTDTQAFYLHSDSVSFPLRKTLQAEQWWPGC